MTRGYNMKNENMDSAKRNTVEILLNGIIQEASELEFIYLSSTNPGLVEFSEDIANHINKIASLHSALVNYLCDKSIYPNEIKIGD